MKHIEKINFLLQGASWQDSLLQSYRSFHLTFQSILLAIGIGLVVAVMSLNFGVPTLILLLVFIAVGLLQCVTNRQFKRIVISRGEDVNFWHREIILVERDLQPAERFFTKFKVFQKLHRQDVEYLQTHFLSEVKVVPEDVNVLIEKGLGHTRKVVDEQLFDNIALIWMLLAIANVVISILKLLSH